MKKAVLLLTFLVLVGQTSIAQSKKELKEKEKLEKYTAVKELINSNSFVFKADDALTQKGRRISLNTSDNLLTVHQSNVEADLPYFGVVQFASTTSESGVQFNCEAKNYQVEFNDKKQKISVKFSASNKNEYYDLYLTVSGSGYTTLSINSNRRSTISYNGKISKVEGATQN
ncbi:MAG TPA: DUF4251 domain-containing protein [Mangrovimonas sp.]|nr:DUF4251 domain-containing protein [Mangrovimonas sp.]